MTKKRGAFKVMLIAVSGCWFFNMVRILFLQQQAHEQANSLAAPSNKVSMMKATNTTVSSSTKVEESNLPNSISSTSTTATINHDKDEVFSSSTTSENQKQLFQPNPDWYKNYIDEYIRVWYPQPPTKWCMLAGTTLEDIEGTTSRWAPKSGEKSTGLLYVKSYKTGSSTCEGIAWNIAHHVGKRLFNVTTNDNNINSPNQHCRAYTRHEFANHRLHGQRNRSQSLLWSFVRNPAKRDISHVYHFQIGREDNVELLEDPTKFQLYLETKVKGRQTRYLYPTKLPSTAKLWPKQELRGGKNNTAKKQAVLDLLNKKIIQNYEFLGVTERMYESLAVMVLLWGLHPEDVIVLDSKRSGGYDDGGHNESCTKIPRPTSEFINATTEYFQTRHKYWNSDYWLYELANKCLDLTIKKIGTSLVQAMIEQIQQLQQIANEKCTSVAIFPCSSQGTYQYELSQTHKQGCYIQDAGCGHRCIDDTLQVPSSSHNKGML